MRRDHLAALLDMAIAARRAINRMLDISEDEFLASEDLQWFTFSQIVIIGEAANRVPKDIQAEYPDIPWPEAISMRNRLVHGYDSIDWRTVYRTVKKDFLTLDSALGYRLSPTSVKADFEAKLRVLRHDEGGRQTPIPAGYRSEFQYVDYDDKGVWLIWPLRFFTADGEVPYMHPVPEEVYADFFILDPDLRESIHRPRLRPGVRFYLSEGSRKTVEGEVTRLIGLAEE